MGRRLASLGNGSESVERPCAKILSSCRSGEDRDAVLVEEVRLVAFLATIS